MKYVLTFLLFGIMMAVHGQEDLLLTYSKGACMGTCPVYEVTINRDGLLTYEGKFNVERTGIYQRQLESKELKKLKRKLWWKRMKRFNQSYGADIMDAPMTTISYHKKDTSYTAKIKGSFPEPLASIDPYLRSLWDIEDMTYNWEEVKKEEPKTDRGLASQTIIVELQPRVKVEKWVEKYSKYKLSVAKQLTPSKPIYLLEFDHHRIHTPQLIIQMQQDREVKNVEPNTMVKMR